jgi:hypothetical protein
MKKIIVLVIMLLFASICYGSGLLEQAELQGSHPPLPSSPTKGWSMFNGSVDEGPVSIYDPKLDLVWVITMVNYHAHISAIIPRLDDQRFIDMRWILCRYLGYQKFCGPWTFPDALWVMLPGCFFGAPTLSASEDGVWIFGHGCDGHLWRAKLY